MPLLISIFYNLVKIQEPVTSLSECLFSEYIRGVYTKSALIISNQVCLSNHDLLCLVLCRPVAVLTVKYCGLGLKVKDLIESTGNQVTVQFMSGTHHSGRGFYLSYSTTEHTGKHHHHSHLSVSRLGHVTGMKFG